MGYNFGTSPQLKQLNMSNFRGVDFANNATQVAKNRSPEMQNIISDLAGKPVKRTGYETIARFGAKINGIYRLKTEEVEKFIVHAGTNLYEWSRTDGDFAKLGTLLYSDMNNIRSTAFQNNGRLYILDGKTYLCYGEFDGSYSVKKVTDIATVPQCVINLNPDGTDGDNRHDVNVLTSKRTYAFYVASDKTDVKEFHLTADNSLKLDDGHVTARKMNADGDWVDMVETTDFTVDRNKGIITFKSAVEPSPVLGVSNLEITFSVEQEEDKTADLINKCTIAIQYGLNGSTDRVFVSGNPTAQNFHYWSEIDDPCYFAGMNYAYLGQDSSAIMGYSRIGNALAVHKEDNQQDHTIFLITGSYNESSQKTNFAISGSVAGVGAISKYCFCNLGTEPMFLARQGVYALTTQYLTAERYAQNRSYYVNPKLTKERNLSEAVAIEFNGYYYLCVGNVVYVADSRNKNYERNEPQSEYQYEWYYLTNIEAHVWWEYDGRLFFGDRNGNIKRFMLAEENSAAHNSYNDDGAPIYAKWCSPLINADILSRYKTLKNFLVTMAPDRRSSADISYRVDGEQTLVTAGTISMNIFSFDDIDFSNFTFETMDVPRTIATNTKAKKWMYIQFVIENNVAGEGFGFYEMELLYTIVGKYKG